jgi:hypothetical protein
MHALAALLALAPLQPTQAAPEARPTPRALTGEAAREDLALFREAIERIHPGLGRYAPAADFARACDALQDAVDGGTDDLTLYRELSRVAGGLRCGHTRVEAPEWLAKWRARNPSLLPFRFALVDGRMFVLSAAAASGLAPGSEVLSIEGRAVAELVEAIGATVPLDGWTDSIRASRLESAYEFEESGFDHYLPLFVGFSARWRLSVRAAEGAPPSELEVAPLALADWQALGPRVARDLPEAVRWRALDERSALLTVETFVNYRRPVDAEALFARVFGEIAAAGHEHLVLDLRACGGGSSDVAWTLARFLVDVPLEFGGERLVRCTSVGELRPHLETWDESAYELAPDAYEARPGGWFRLHAPASPPLAPHPARFQGPIDVLVGPYNASGATMLVARLAEARAVRTLGEPTGGSAEGPTAGLIFFLTLPHSGIRVNVPAVREASGVRAFRSGFGVEPDVLVVPTLADRLAGRDPVLAAALR